MKSKEGNEKHPWPQHTELPLVLTRLGILEGHPGLGLHRISSRAPVASEGHS